MVDMVQSQIFVSWPFETMNEGVQFQLNEIFQNGLENALFPKLGMG